MAGDGFHLKQDFASILGTMGSAADPQVFVEVGQQATWVLLDALYLRRRLG